MEIAPRPAFPLVVRVPSLFIISRYSVQYTYTIYRSLRVYDIGTRYHAHTARRPLYYYYYYYMYDVYFIREPEAAVVMREVGGGGGGGHRPHTIAQRLFIIL